MYQQSTGNSRPSMTSQQSHGLSAHMIEHHVAAECDHLQQAHCSVQLLLKLLLLRVAAAHKAAQ
jgi:hypothetical protein